MREKTAVSETSEEVRARSTLFDLPLLDELRTYCYEHKIEEIPAFFIV